MNEKLHGLEQRKRMLISGAATQRMVLAQTLLSWRRHMAIVDHGVTAYRYLAKHPLLLASGAACLVLLRPRRVFGLLKNGWLIWSLMTEVKRDLS